VIQHATYRERLLYEALLALCDNCYPDGGELSAPDRAVLEHARSVLSIFDREPIDWNMEQPS